MTRSSKKPPGTVSTSHNNNGDISSINETPNSNSQYVSNTHDDDEIMEVYGNGAVDADETTDCEATSRNKSVISANRDSIWKYTELVISVK